MIAPVIIIGRKTGEGNEAPVSRPMRAAPHSRNHPERRTFAVVAICGQQGFRARAAGLVAPFDETETWARNQEIRLPAIPFQSVARSADTGASITAILSVDPLRFNFSRRFQAPGSLINSGLISAVLQDTSRYPAKSFQDFILSAQETGLAAGVVGQHTDRRGMKCPTKTLKDSTK